MLFDFFQRRKPLKVHMLESSLISKHRKLIFERFHFFTICSTISHKKNRMYTKSTSTSNNISYIIFLTDIMHKQISFWWLMLFLLFLHWRNQDIIININQYYNIFMNQQTLECIKIITQMFIESMNLTNTLASTLDKAVELMVVNSISSEKLNFKSIITQWWYHKEEILLFLSIVSKRN